MSTPRPRLPGSPGGRPSGRPGQRPVTLVAMPLLVVLLAACGSAQPGVAAQVGDQSITVSDVDDESALLCEAVEGDLEQPLPMSLARYQILTGEISRSIADQIADEYDVEPGADYQNAVSQAETQVAAYPEATRDTLLSVSTTQAYVRSILDAAARQSFADEGLSDPELSQVDERGQEIFSTWPDSHTLDIDPRFGFEFVDGGFVQADTGVSFPISEIATSAQAEQPDPAVTAALPASQRCG